MTYKSVNDLTPVCLKRSVYPQTSLLLPSSTKHSVILNCLLKRRVMAKIDFHLGERRMETAYRPIGLSAAAKKAPSVKSFKVAI